MTPKNRTRMSSMVRRLWVLWIATQCRTRGAVGFSLKTTITPATVDGVAVQRAPLFNYDEASPYCLVASTPPGPPINFLATQVWPSARVAASSLLRHLNVNCTVCELGCGPGLPSLTAAHMGAARVVATDLDPFALRLVQKSAQQQNLSIETQLFDLVNNEIGRLPQADLYVLSDVFESAAVARGAARICSQALARGSRVWVFAQSDRVQREVFLDEMRALYLQNDTLTWIKHVGEGPPPTHGSLWLCDVDETAVRYG